MAEPELVLACLEGVKPEGGAESRLILAAARAATVECPEYADLFYHSGQAAIAAGDYETAEVLLARALELNPTYNDALFLAAHVAQRREREDR